MNKFLLNIENTLAALSATASSTELNVNYSDSFFLPSLKQMPPFSLLFQLSGLNSRSFSIICLEIGAQKDGQMR